jgi:hypothetical protein
MIKPHNYKVMMRRMGIFDVPASGAAGCKLGTRENVSQESDLNS